MPIPWQIGLIVLNVDPGIVEPRGELAREGVMHFKLAHALLPQHPRDFFVKTVDIPLGRNPGWTAKGLKLWVLGIQVSQDPVRVAVKQQPNALRWRQFSPTRSCCAATRRILCIARARD